MAAQVAPWYPDMNAGNNHEDDEGGGARRFLPPPGIHPNNAVFGAVALPKPLTWQRREHLIQRRSILGRVGQLLKRNAQLVAATTAPPTGADPHAKTWALARKLEVLIFLNSASLMEYSNVDSLARRVQALTASIVNKKIRRQNSSAGDLTASSSPPAAATATPTPYHRQVTPVPCAPIPFPMTGSSTGAAAPGGYVAPPLVPTPLPFMAVPPAPAVQMPGFLAPQPVAIPAAAASAAISPRPDVSSPGGGLGLPLPGIGFLIHKRSADEMQQSGALSPASAALLLEEKPAKRARRSVDLGAFLFRGRDELSSLVWSYVDGVQIMRCRGVNRAARELAPQLVTSLQLSCNAVQIALATQSFSHTAMRSFGGGSSGVNTCILRECVNLKHLEIVSLSSGMTFGKLSMRAVDCPQRFVVTHDDHEQIVLALAQQLRVGTFPRLTRLGITCLFTNEEADGEADVLLNTLMMGCCPQLEELCLPGNSFGDYGAAKVAQMLRSRVCPKLTRLDLRRNFIGEDGIRSLCHALADGCAPHLLELCFGGNTITDSSFHHVLYAMESGQLRHLRFLGIEMNYLSVTSMEMLGRSIGKLVCPLLTQISYSDNSVDNAEAKRAIATAVYHERVRRERRLQQLRDGTHTGDNASSDEDDGYSSEGE